MNRIDRPSFRLAMRAARILALTATLMGSLTAQQDGELQVSKLNWQILPDGSPAILPNPSTGMADGPPFRVFPTLTKHRYEILWDWLRAFGREHGPGIDPTGLLFLAPGSRDAASSSPPELVLKVHGTDGAIELELGVDGEGWERRRAELLVLHALRRVRDGELEAAPETLARWVEADDPHLAAAAQEAVARLDGRPFFLRRPRLPKLKEDLGQLMDADVVLRVDQRRLPDMTRVQRALRAWSVRRTLEEIRLAGGVLTPAQGAGGQVLADRPALLADELARRFGNWRVDRTLAGLATREGEVEFDVWHRGAFDVDAAREGIRFEGHRAEERAEGGFAFRGLPKGEVFDVAADSLRLRSREEGMTPGGAGLRDALLDAGIQRGDAVWFHVRPNRPRWDVKLKIWKHLQWIGRFESLTVRASFDPVLDVRLVGVARSVDDREVLQRALGRFVDWTESLELDNEADLSVSEQQLELSWRFTEGTAIEAIEHIVERSPVVF